MNFRFGSAATLWFCLKMISRQRIILDTLRMNTLKDILNISFKFH
jgi:hypothetical protein